MGQAKPLVSVVVTSFNQGPYLAECLESCLAEDYPNQEHFFINNGSTDETDEVFEHYIAKWPHPVVYLNNKENLGICKALNMALEQAKGKYLIDLAADDLFCNQRLTKQVMFFEAQEPNTGFIHGNHEDIDVHGNKTGQMHKEAADLPQGEIYQEVLRRFFFSTPSIMYRKEALEELNGFDERMLFEDNDIILRLARYYPAYYQDEILTKKRKVPKSLSDTYTSANLREALDTIQLFLQKAHSLNRSQEDYLAFQNLVSFYIRYALRHRSIPYARKFYSLLEKGDKTHHYLIKFQTMGLPVWWFLRKLAK